MNGTILVVLNVYMSTQCLPPSFRIRLTAREEMSSKHFQDGHHGGHLGYRNITIIAYLNCYVAPKPPTRFRLIRVRVYEQMCSEDFHDGRNFESECCSDVSNQVSAQSDSRFGMRWRFEDFQEGRYCGHLANRNRKYLAILNLRVAPMPPSNFGLNLTEFGRRCGLKIFKMATVAAILGIRTK